MATKSTVASTHGGSHIAANTTSALLFRSGASSLAKDTIAEKNAIFDAKVEVAFVKNRAARSGLNIIVAAGWSQWHSRESLDDRGTVLCTQCNTHSCLLLCHPCCGQNSCMKCWMQRADKCPNNDCLRVIPSPCWELCAKLKKFHAKDVRCRSESICGVCQTSCFITVAPDGCDHFACERCWCSWAESQIEFCAKGRQIGIPCIGCCHEAINPSLLHLLGRSSVALNSFGIELAAERRRRERVQLAGIRMTKAESDLNPGPDCQFCHGRTFALLHNASPCCEVGACEECWCRWVESQIRQCMEERRSGVRCIAPECAAAIDHKLWLYLGESSESIGKFQAEIGSEHKRMACKTPRAAYELQKASSVLDPGPTCIICRDRHWALLGNARCHHGACEVCWSQWAEIQIPVCRAARQDVPHCFAPRCTELMDVALWQHCGTLCKTVKDFEERFASRRRRLCSNEFYPPAVQVNCPRPDCFGLGYLGFETVMCFMCEHVWIPDEPGMRPVDVDVEKVMGIEVKRCPRCQEPIEKNGGCDHMTCRCKHEFWWTTLLPYRTGQ